MTFRHLEILDAVRSAGSMTRAAERLSISQPSVSQAVRELEEEFGAVLFERLGKRLVPTEAGMLCIGHGRRLLEEREEMSEAMRGASESGPIRLGATVTIGTYLVPRLVGIAGRPLFPVVENTSRIERLLLDGDLDLALVEGETSSPLLLRRRFLRDRLRIVCSPKNPAWRLRASPRDLRGRGFYIREEGSGSRELFVGAMRRKGIAFRIAGELNNTEALKNFALWDEDSFAVVSELAMDDRLRQVEAPFLDLGRWFDIVYHKDKKMSPPLASLIAAIEGLGTSLAKNAPSPRRGPGAAAAEEKRRR